MPNLATIIKNELQRIARREVNQNVAPLKKQNTDLKKNIADLKKRIAVLEKENKQLSKRIIQQSAVPSRVKVSAVQGDVDDDFRITGKQIKSLRSRLSLSQAEFAELLSVSVNIVTIWESKSGRINLRKADVKQAITSLKSMKKAEVWERIGKEKKTARKTGKKNKTVKNAAPKKKALARKKPAARKKKK